MVFSVSRPKDPGEGGDKSREDTPDQSSSSERKFPMELMASLMVEMTDGDLIDKWQKNF